MWHYPDEASASRHICRSSDPPRWGTRPVTRANACFPSRGAPCQSDPRESQRARRLRPSPGPWQVQFARSRPVLPPGHADRSARRGRRADRCRGVRRARHHGPGHRRRAARGRRARSRGDRGAARAPTSRSGSWSGCRSTWTAREGPQADTRARFRRARVARTSACRSSSGTSGSPPSRPSATLRSRRCVARPAPRARRPGGRGNHPRVLPRAPSAMTRRRVLLVAGVARPRSSSAAPASGCCCSAARAGAGRARSRSRVREGERLPDVARAARRAGASCGSPASSSPGHASPVRTANMRCGRVPHRRRRSSPLELLGSPHGPARRAARRDHPGRPDGPRGRASASRSGGSRLRGEPSMRCSPIPPSSPPRACRRKAPRATSSPTPTPSRSHTPPERILRTMIRTLSRGVHARDGGARAERARPDAQQAVTLASLVEEETARAGGASAGRGGVREPAAQGHAAPGRPDRAVRARPTATGASRRSDLARPTPHNTYTIAWPAADADRQSRAGRARGGRARRPTSPTSTSSRAATARTSSTSSRRSTTRRWRGFAASNASAAEP